MVMVSVWLAHLAEPAVEMDALVPRIDLSVCTACGQCVVVCPVAAVGVGFRGDGSWAPSIDAARCSLCFDCEAACPEQAIDIPLEIAEVERTLS